MPPWSLDKSSTLILFTLTISLLLNVVNIRRFAWSKSTDVRHYSYVGDDHPRELPIDLDTVAMTFGDSEHYNITGIWTWLEWQSITHFPKGDGIVRLGPNAREFEVSIFRQLRCIDTLRQALINGADAKSEHCLNLLRQTVLCGSDITLDALNVYIDGKLIATNGVGMTHVCRDWSRVYQYVTENQNGPNWQGTSNASLQ